MNKQSDFISSLRVGCIVALTSGDLATVKSLASFESNGFTCVKLGFTKKVRLTSPEAIHTEASFTDHGILLGSSGLVSVMAVFEPREDTTEDTIGNTLNWFACFNPKPDAFSWKNQLACHIEEFTEMLEALVPSPDARQDYENTIISLKEIKDRVYMGDITLPDMKGAKIEFLDSLCDQIVTATGVAYNSGFDIVGALKEVNASNFSKFENNKPLYHPETGKGLKGKDYFPPKLERFIL